MMKFAGVDQVESLLTQVLESGNNLSFEGLHAIEVSLMTGEVEVEMFARESIRHAGKPRDRILDNVAKKSLAHLAVIDRHAKRKLRIHATAALPKFEIVSPAGEEKLPLQVGHFYQLGAVFLLHARVFERHKERRHKSALGIAQIIKQVERLLSVFLSFARQTDDEGAHRKYVVPVQNFHSLQDHVAPLVRLVRIRLPFHVGIEEPGAAGLQADDRIGVAFVRMRRALMLNVRIGNDQRSQTLNNRRILYDWRHRDVRSLNEFNSGDADDAFEEFLQ